MRGRNNGNKNFRTGLPPEKEACMVASLYLFLATGRYVKFCMPWENDGQPRD